MIDYDKIKRIIKEKNITTEELAERINVSQKSLERSLRNENAEVIILVKICNVLDVCIKDVIRRR